jgi:hypothetical protein
MSNTLKTLSPMTPESGPRRRCVVSSRRNRSLHGLLETLTGQDAEKALRGDKACILQSRTS